jgi:hypothetical protein
MFGASSKPGDDPWKHLIQAQDPSDVFDNAFRPKPDDPWIQLIQAQEDPVMSLTMHLHPSLMILGFN